MFGKKTFSEDKLKKATLEFIKALSQNSLAVKEDAIQSKDIAFCTELYNACLDLDKSICNILYGLKEPVLYGRFPSDCEVTDSESC